MLFFVPATNVLWNCSGCISSVDKNRNRVSWYIHIQRVVILRDMVKCGLTGVLFKRGQEDGGDRKSTLLLQSGVVFTQRIYLLAGRGNSSVPGLVSGCVYGGCVDRGCFLLTWTDSWVMSWVWLEILAERWLNSENVLHVTFSEALAKNCLFVMFIGLFLSCCWLLEEEEEGG